jgi:hypothetical protein
MLPCTADSQTTVAVGSTTASKTFSAATPTLFPPAPNSIPLSQRHSASPQPLVAASHSSPFPTAVLVGEPSQRTAANRPSNSPAPTTSPSCFAAISTFAIQNVTRTTTTLQTAHSVGLLSFVITATGISSRHLIPSQSLRTPESSHLTMAELGVWL